MATLTLCWSSDPDALLAHAAAPFTVAGRPAEPLPLLAVRQGGIRDAVYELAGDAGCDGWLGTPVVVFHELPELLAGELSPLTSFERRALIASCLDSTELPLLRRAARSSRGVQRIEALLGDLIAADVAVDALAQKLAIEGRDAWMQQRDAELVALFASYRVAIDGLPRSHDVPRTDGRDGLLQAARAVRSDPDALRRRLRRPFDASDRRSIDIYGLADLRRGWAALIDALHAAECVDALRIHVTSSSDPAALDVTDYRRIIAERADLVEHVEPRERPAGLAHLRRSLFRAPGETVPVSGEVRGIAAPDMQRELEIVVRRVKRLIIDHDVAPRSIAIVARKARPYANRAIELLARAGVPATARLRHTLSDVPAVRMLLRILTAAGNGWSMTALGQLAASPYLDVAIDTALLMRVRGTARPRTIAEWETLIDAVLAAVREGADPDDELPGEAQLEQLRRQFADFALGARPLERPQTISQWITLTLAALGCAPSDAPAPDGWADGIFGLPMRCAAPVAGVRDPTADGALIDALQLDLSALRGVVSLLNDWRTSLALLPADDRSLSARISSAEWARELETVLEDEELGQRTTQRHGVQVVEALAAAGRPFDHVFVVGMESGAFPGEPGRSVLFSDAECIALRERGLPFEPASEWFAHEATLFESIANAARQSLTLSYSYADGSGTPQLASTYYDETASHFADAEQGVRWEERPGGSERVAGSLADVSSPSDLALFAAHAWRTGSESDAATVRSALAELDRASAPSGLVQRILHAARIEQHRALARASDITDRADLAHPWNGRVDDVTTLDLLARHVRSQVWSATTLEKYGRCGFSYLAQRLLKADELPDEDEEESVLERGTLMHAILADVYGGLTMELGEAPIHAATEATVTRIVTDAVARALDSEVALRIGNDGLRAARARQIGDQVLGYVLWEIAQSENGKPAPRRPLHVELGFGNPGDTRAPLDLTDGSRTFRLRGRIDRVDAITDPNAAGYLYIVDHKMGGGSLTPLGDLRDGGALLQLQLYMNAARHLLDDDRIFGGAYQVIRERSATGALNSASIVKKGLQVKANATQQKAAERVDGAPKAALDLIDGIVAGQFAARTPGNSPCLSYCSLRHACREDRLKKRP